MRNDPGNFDELQAWIDSFEPQPWRDDDVAALDAPPDFAIQVDLVAGEFFRNTWRRRLANAQGDCGYVARQMRKAGVPLDLALAILLTPDHRALSTPASPVDGLDADGNELPGTDAGHIADAYGIRPRATAAA